MEEQKNIRVVFTEKAESVFSDLLKNNNIKEDDEELLNEINEEQETPTVIVKNTVISIAKKILPEKSIVESLQKNLQVPENTAKKIVDDIKNKLLPLLLVYPDEKFNDPNFREEISKKVFESEEKVPKNQKGNFQEELLEKVKAGQGVSKLEPVKQETPVLYVKEVPITDVDKNAENMRKQGENSITEDRDILPKKNTNQEPHPQNKKQDTYREPIE